jgi:hypothetical protein
MIALHFASTTIEGFCVIAQLALVLTPSFQDSTIMHRCHICFGKLDNVIMPRREHPAE